MFAEVCRFYGWTLDYVFTMPAARFFAMLEASKKLDAIEKVEAANIAAISICNGEYYLKVVEQYNQRLEYLSSPVRTNRDVGQESPKEQSIDPKDQEQQKYMMMQLFTMKKRLH